MSHKVFANDPHVSAIAWNHVIFVVNACLGVLDGYTDITLHKLRKYHIVAFEIVFAPQVKKRNERVLSQENSAVEPTKSMPRHKYCLFLQNQQSQVVHMGVIHLGRIIRHRLYLISPIFSLLNPQRVQMRTPLCIFYNATV